jgi:hypothetical protein
LVAISSKADSMEQQLAETQCPDFIDRRAARNPESPSFERRQFKDGNRSQRPEVAEFAEAVDTYKIENRRRFITFEELYDIMCSLGYHK